jgi:diguanylate cyclase (GGDEF)-like protein
MPLWRDSTLRQDAAGGDASGGSDVDSTGTFYRRLADVFHDVLSEESLDAVLDRIADTLADLVPHDSLTIYRADEPTRMLVPVLARDRWAEEILNTVCHFGQGITGWAAEHREPVLVRQVQLDPRASVVPGTPEDEPESLISVPLIARGSLKGALNVYRLGESASFTEQEFELAKRFGDAAALALDNAETRARLEHQAQTDSLTGLYNHRSFHERLRSELGRASRSREPVAVLMIDIDEFKRVNDIHGHGTGDRLLVRLADLLSTTVRGSDVVCRVGGEEFAVIMAGFDSADALSVARRLAARLAETPFDPAEGLTVSIGIAQAPDDAMNPRDLAACAEAAMMSAKSQGEGRIVLFSDWDAERPGASTQGRRDARSIAHLKLLQSLVGQLNRLNDVRQIGAMIVSELRTLIDYHNGRVYLVDDDVLVPIAFRGELGPYSEENAEVLACRIGEGITGRVAETGRSLLIPNALECDYAVQVPGTPEIEESIVAVPLMYASRVIGVIVISKLGVDQFDGDDVRLLEVLAGHASVALENARLYEAARLEAEHARESAEIASALLEFGRKVATAEGLDDRLHRIVELSARLLGVPRTSVWLQSEPDGDLRLRAHWGYSGEQEEILQGLQFTADEARQLFDRDRPYVVARDELGDGYDLPLWMSRRFAVAPLRLDLNHAGCLVVCSPEPEGDFTDRTMRLLTGISDQARLALTNAWSFETLERTFFSTVEALANALEASDQHTASHARSLTDTALRVGEELGLDTATLKRLELGSLFHDIGKIGIPSEILTKPGPLTADERAVVELHPSLGERILAPIERLADVRPIVRHCHERWDGTGYPDGIAGEEIPLEARIIFVCDAFHAMTTDRPYRKRLAEEEARRRLAEAAGTQFDPRVVEAFLHRLP